jgi:hypothetical protein
MAGGAGLGAMFEQQPFLDGKQLVHCRLALAQTQFLHLPPPLHRQHCGILPESTVVQYMQAGSLKNYCMLHAA